MQTSPHHFQRTSPARAYSKAFVGGTGHDRQTFADRDLWNEEHLVHRTLKPLRNDRPKRLPRDGDVQVQEVDSALGFQCDVVRVNKHLGANVAGFFVGNSGHVKVDHNDVHLMEYALKKDNHAESLMLEDNVDFVHSLSEVILVLHWIAAGAISNPFEVQGCAPYWTAQAPNRENEQIGHPLNHFLWVKKGEQRLRSENSFVHAWGVSVPA